MHNQESTKDDFMESVFEILAKINKYYREFSKTEKEVENNQIEQPNENNAEGNSSLETSESEKKIHMQIDLNVNISIDPKLDNDKIGRFQDVMKKVIEESLNSQVKTIAQTFHDNPVESMNLLQSIVSEKAIENSKELIKQTSDTQNMIENIRSTVNLNDPNAMNQIATLNYLHTNEQKKLDLANNLLNELKSLDKETINEDELTKENKQENVKEKTKDREIDGPER